MALGLLPLAAATAQAQQEIGDLSIVRSVKVTKAPITEGRDYVDAKDNQRVKNNYGLRTGRRSKAEIRFDDHSILRVNERTDMVVYDAKSLRNIQLNQGAVWVKVAKGVNTTITTPTATATARGTQFEVRANGEILVFEGSVAVSAGGQTVLVESGNKVSVGTGGQPTSVIPLSPAELPSGSGGATTGGSVKGGGEASWFEEVTTEAGVVVSTGTNDLTAIRQAPINEVPADELRKTTTTVIIRGLTRAPVIPDERREFGLVDNTDTNYLFPALALAATIAAEPRSLAEIPNPSAHGTVYAYAGRPTFGGLRTNLVGSIGGTTYAYEANVLQFWREPETDVLSNFGSVLYLERRLDDHIKVFAGRRKFYHGPVFSNLADTQLIANRYSGAGIRYDRGALSVEAAYVYDANRYVKGAQQGTLASVFYRAYGGVFGGHFLQADDVPGGGHGRSFSASLPVVKGEIDGYAEIGVGVDGRDAQTYGVYLPGFFQRTGVDVFAEYGLKKGETQAYSVTGLYEMKKGPQLRGSIDWVGGVHRFSIGASFRF